MGDWVRMVALSPLLIQLVFILEKTMAIVNVYEGNMHLFKGLEIRLLKTEISNFYFPATAQSIPIRHIQFQTSTQQLECNSLQCVLSNVSGSWHWI
jgi:hypothetical protein